MEYGDDATALRQPLPGWVILLRAALALALLAALFYAGRAVHAAMITAPDRAAASLMLEQAATLSHRVNRLTAQGATPETIIIGTEHVPAHAKHVLFRRDDGALDVLRPPRVDRNVPAAWRFARDVDLPGVGEEFGEFIALAEVSRAVCANINDVLFGPAALSEIPTFGRLARVGVEPAPPGPSVTPGTNVLVFASTHSPALRGRTAACARDGEKYYIYQALGTN